MIALSANGGIVCSVGTAQQESGRSVQRGSLLIRLA